MRSVVALTVLVASLAAAATAAAGGPPPIKEVFTPLPCPAKPVTTLDLQGCVEKRILGTDRLIDAKAQAIYAKLHSAAARTRFVAGERSWLSYRRANCLSRADVYEGGSLSPVEYGNCVVARNREHLKDLTAFLKALGPH